jgi:hypothetical protein
MQGFAQPAPTLGNEYLADPVLRSYWRAGSRHH